MDIRIEALEGPVPAGETFVSMRIGDYQKQSRLGCTKSYRFPQDDGNGFARVEVFQRIGHVSISLEKLRASDQDVQVPLESADVKFLPMRIGMQSSVEKGNGKVKTRLDSALRYLSQHQLEEIIADAMREVIHEKPEDPHTFLSNQILKHAKKPQFLPPLRNEKDLPPRPSSKNQKPNMSEKLPPIGGRELASLREEARDVLLQSAKDGSLAKALTASSENVDMGELRKEAATALLNAAKDGTLDAALQETRTPKDNELEELRQQARATLLQGARDGSLQDALKSTSEEVSVDAVRLEARDALLRSAQDGSLANALQMQAQKGDQQKVEELRSQARDALLKASMNGGLEQVLSKGKAEKKANQVVAEPQFKFKPSVGSWLQKKPHEVPKPWYYRRVSVAEEDEKVVKGLQAVIAEKDGEIAALKAQLLQTGMDVAPKQAESAPLPPKAEESQLKAKPQASLKDFRNYYAENVHSFGSGMQETLYAKFPQPKPAPKATVPKVEEAPVKFALRPSVGTWLTPKLNKPTGPTAAPAAPSVAPTASGKASTPFALKPSVGTWLTFKINNDRPKSSSILDRTHSKQLAMNQEELIQGYQKEIKKRDQEIEHLKSTLKP